MGRLRVEYRMFFVVFNFFADKPSGQIAAGGLHVIMKALRDIVK